MRRVGAIVLLLLLATLACADDRVALRRGPLGPASYRVAVAATGQGKKRSEHRSATMTVSPSAGGASFTLQTATREVIRARLQRSADGAIVLEDVRRRSVVHRGGRVCAGLCCKLAP